MKKLLFINKDLKFQGNKDCSPVEGTLAVGNLFNNAITIIKRKIKFLLFNKTQFNVTNYTSKCDTAYVELNPDFIQTLTPKIITGSTDNPLADNGIQVITSNVKNIVVYDQQLEFVNSTVEPNTSTLKLKDAFVNSLLREETDPIFTASDAFNITNTDIDNWNNKLDEEIDTLQSVTDRNPVTSNPMTITDGVSTNVLGKDFVFVKKANFGISMIASYLGESFIQAAYAFSSWNPLRLQGSKVKIDENTGGAFIHLVNGNIGINKEVPTANFHSVGTVRHENITNAQGDSTFTKQVVAKVDGTFGIEDKSTPRQPFSVFVKSTYSGISELYSADKPYNSLISAMNAVIALQGNLSNHKFYILDSATYEMTASGDLAYLHIESTFNPTIIQRQPIGMQNFTLIGYGMKYKIEPNSTLASGGYSSSASMLSWENCKVYLDFGGFIFAKDNPPIDISRAIMYFYTTQFIKFKTLSLEYIETGGTYIQGVFVNDFFTGICIAEQGDCKNVFFNNSNNSASVNIINSFTNTKNTEIQLSSNCLLKINTINQLGTGTVRLFFTNSVELLGGRLTNTTFQGHGWITTNNQNYLTGKAEVYYTQNINNVFNNNVGDTKTILIPNNKYNINNLKNLYLQINDDNGGLRVQQSFYRNQDTDYPVSQFVLDNVIVNMGLSNKPIFYAGATLNLMVNGLNRANIEAYGMLFKNSNTFFNNGGELIKWDNNSNPIDFTVYKFIVSEGTDTIKHDGIISNTPNLLIHNINKTTYNY